MDDSDPKPSPIDGRRRRSEQTRQAIIDAYLDLVRANQAPPTAQDIAKRAGISTRSVFERFTDLLTLSLAVADYAFEQALAQAAVPNVDADFNTRLKAQVEVRAAIFEQWLPLWRTLLDGLNYLRETKAMAVVLIAHSEIKRFEAPDSEPFDRYQIKLHKGANAMVREWADIIGFAHHETAIKKENNGFSTRSRGVSTGRRLLRVAEIPACVAKNRYSLPDVIPLSWDSLLDAMNPAAKAA